MFRSLSGLLTSLFFFPQFFDPENFLFRQLWFFSFIEQFWFHFILATIERYILHCQTNKSTEDISHFVFKFSRHQDLCVDFYAPMSAALQNYLFTSSHLAKIVLIFKLLLLMLGET